jgi:predicted porin
MKKSLIALAALAAVGVASAQSSVTISGVLDAGYVHTKEVATGAAKGNVNRGNNNRINFSVSEDLGGGMRAIANVGMRFEPATGLAESSGARPLFQGETRVGVSGGFGTVMFGRGLTALQGPNGGFADPWGVTTVAGSIYSPGFVSDYAGGGEGRIDTAIFYTSPNISGFTLSASFSPRKVALAATTVATTPFSKTHSAVNALYVAGPLGIGAGVENNRAGDSFTNIYGSYDLGVAKLHAAYGTIKGGTAAERNGLTLAATANNVATGNTAAGSAYSATTGTGIVAVNGEINTWTIGAVVPMGATSLRAGYSVWNGNGAPGQKDDAKLGLGVRHNLSKRTYVYSDIATLTRKNNTGTVDATGNRAGTRQMQLDLGVAHSF